MSNDPPCERLTVVVLGSQSRDQSLRELGGRIVRDSMNWHSGNQIDTVFVVYHSEIGLLLAYDFLIVQGEIQQRFHTRKIGCTSSILFRGNGPSFQIVLDQWYPVTISFYDQHRFDLRATRGLTNYSIIQVHEGPSEDNPDSDD